MITHMLLLEALFVKCVSRVENVLVNYINQHSFFPGKKILSTVHVTKVSVIYLI